MAKLKLQNYWLLIVSAILWLAIDLLSKSYVVEADLGKIQILNDFLYIYYIKNTGVAFGIELGYIFQIVISIIVLMLLIYFGVKYLCPSKRYSFLNQFLLGIIIGGGIGNLLNRVQLGYVMDFIVLHPLPVFNIADIGITIGLILLFIVSCRQG